MVRHEKERPDPAPGHLLLRLTEQLSGDPAAPVRLLDSHRADVRGEIPPRVEVVLDHAEPADDPVIPEREEPCGDRGLSGEGFFDANEFQKIPY